MSPSISIVTARRIALAAQGFNTPRATGRIDVRHFRRAMERMGILQLDSVNVCCRSHYLPMLARLGRYDRDALDHWLWRSRENFEFLAHEASISPMALHPLLRFRMETGRWGTGERLEHEQPDYFASVLEQVRERGPLSTAGLDEPGRKTGPWWGLSKGKIALERLYVTGRLAIHERSSQFVTRYDLPERVIPAAIWNQPPPSFDECLDSLMLLSARSLGIATATDIADYYRLPIRAVRERLPELVARGALRPVVVENWREPAFLDTHSATPRKLSARALLSPFDPLVWHRPRTERLFDFRYRIEIYVPKPKRVHGYYVLPFLLGDRLVARVDLKSDRHAGVLRVPSVFAESGVDTEEVARELAPTLAELAAFLGLGRVAVGRKGDLWRALRDACKSMEAARK